MAQAAELMAAYEELPEDEKKKAAAAIAASRPLPDPPQNLVGPIWLMTVGAFVALLLVGTILMFVLVLDGKSTEVIGPLVTGALGVLAGLLAPSPVANSDN